MLRSVLLGTCVLALGGGLIGAFTVSGCSTNSASPTYNHDIAPLVAEHCSSCHRDGGVQQSWSSYQLAKTNGPTMSAMMSSHMMPPWPPTSDGGCPSLIGDRRLAQSDIDLMSEWVKGGMPLGDGTPKLPPPPAPFGDLPGISVNIGPDRPYTPDASIDDYHCYLVDPGLTHDQFLTAYKVSASPGVHHLQLWEVSTDQGVSDLAARDAATPEPGFPCASWPPVDMSFITVWGPSDPVRIHPAGTGIRIHGGKKLMIQVHYHQGATTDQTKIGLVLADQVNEEARLTEMSVGGFTLPPRTPGTTVHSQWTLPWNAKLWGVRGHMHYLGTSINVQHDGGCLLSIPQWDWNWQLMYFYQQPMQLTAGDNFTLDCTYNNTTDAEVHDGPTSHDEMCFAYFYMTGIPTQ